MTMRKSTYVAVVAADISLRESLPDLLRELGYEAQGFSSPEQFLASDKVRPADCLILDIAMPGTSGLALQRGPYRLGRDVPIVVITARGKEGVNPPACGVRAVAYLLKPFNDTALLEAIRAVLPPG